MGYYLPELKSSIRYAWHHMSWWYFALLSALALPTETAVLSWPFRLSAQPLDKDTWTFIYKNFRPQLMHINNQEKIILGITFIIFTFITLLIYLIASMAFVALVKKMHDKEARFTISKATLRVFGITLILTILSTIIIGILSLLLSFIPHTLTYILFFGVSMFILASLFIMGAHAMFSAALHDHIFRHSLAQSLHFFKRTMRASLIFLFSVILTDIAFALCITLGASIMLLPLVIVAVLLYNFAIVYAFWGVVITSALLLLILVVSATSLFTLLRVKLWSDYLLQPKN